jgi:hypothetical protein
MTFKDVLEIRTQVHIAERRLLPQLTQHPEYEGDKRSNRTIRTFHILCCHSTSSNKSVDSLRVQGIMTLTFTLDSLLFNKPRNDDPRYNLKDKGKSRPQDSDLLALDMVSAEEGHATGGLQELQYMDNQVCSPPPCPPLYTYDLIERLYTTTVHCY